MKYVPLRIDLLEEGRPSKGDLVTCRGSEELYRVDEVGMRYLVVHVEGNELAKRLLRSADCRKYRRASGECRQARLRPCDL